MAKDLPARHPLTPPEHHPTEFQTFVQNSTPGDQFSSVGVDVDHLVRLSARAEDPEARFRWSCPFCSYHRVWQKMTSFWAHLKVEHESLPQERILSEVTKSARAYQAWADMRSYDYERNNAATWQKVLQAQGPDFDWHVFENWRLTRARPHQSRSTGTSDAKDDAGDQPLSTLQRA